MLMMLMHLPNAFKTFLFLFWLVRFIHKITRSFFLIETIEILLNRINL